MKKKLWLFVFGFTFSLKNTAQLIASSDLNLNYYTCVSPASHSVFDATGNPSVNYEKNGFFWGVRAGVPFSFKELGSVTFAADLSIQPWHGGLLIGHLGNLNYSNDNLFFWTSGKIHKAVSTGISFSLTRQKIINNSTCWYVSAGMGTQISLIQDLKMGISLNIPLELFKNEYQTFFDLKNFKAGLFYRVAKSTSIFLDLSRTGNLSPSVNMGLQYIYNGRMKLKSGFETSSGQAYLSVNLSKKKLDVSMMISYHERLGYTTFFSISNDKY